MYYLYLLFIYYVYIFIYISLSLSTSNPYSLKEEEKVNTKYNKYKITISIYIISKPRSNLFKSQYLSNDLSSLFFVHPKKASA